METNNKPQALRIRRRKVERKKRKQARKLQREYERLNVNRDRPYWEQPEQ